MRTLSSQQRLLSAHRRHTGRLPHWSWRRAFVSLSLSRGFKTAAVIISVALCGVGIHQSSQNLNNWRLNSEEERPTRKQFMFDGATDKYFGNPRNRTEVNGTVCFRWSEELEADQWWSHHPSFEPFSENDEGACFVRMPKGEKRDFFNKLHSVQYDMDKCPQVHTRHMWSTGWGSDFKNVAGGLLYGLENDRPFQISFVKEGYAWQEGCFQAPVSEWSSPSLQDKGHVLLFLPLSLCPPWNMNITPANPFAGDGTISFAWANEYATRQKLWLRKNVYDNIKTKVLESGTRLTGPPISLPCAAMHVRRTDVALKETWARQHFAVSDYLQKLKEKDTNTKNILLFTDDENALVEALELHPEYNWMYLNISRHKGSSGYENHVAANNPANEVIALLSIFKLAKQCDTFVHGYSQFADEIYSNMILTGKNITRLHVDEGLDIFNPSYTNTEAVLMKKLNRTNNTAT